MEQQIVASFCEKSTQCLDWNYRIKRVNRGNMTLFDEKRLWKLRLSRAGAVGVVGSLSPARALTESPDHWQRTSKPPVSNMHVDHDRANPQQAASLNSLLRFIYGGKPIPLPNFWMFRPGELSSKVDRS